MTFSDGAVSETDVDDFGILGEFNIIENDERAVDFDDGSVVDSGGDIIVSGDSLEVGVEKLSFIHDLDILYNNKF